MKFPSLRKLKIGKNYCFLNGLYTFLNKNNYPNLNKFLISNFYAYLDGGVTDSNFFKYFANEFEGFAF